MYWMMAALSMLFPAWKTLEIEPLTTPVKASLRGLHSVSDQELWASGTQNTVLHSTDGGRNWRVKKVAEDMDLDFRDIEAVSKDTVFVQSVGSGSTSRIYRSTDAGVTWRLVFTNPHKQGFFDGIAFWNPKHGVAYSDPVNGSFFLIETRNGGDTWNRLNSLPPAHDKEASFAASGTAITVRPGGGLWFGSGGSAARIFRSPDYGKTWTVADTPLRQGEPPEGCFSLVFWDDLNGCAVGGRYNELDDTTGNCVITTDGGKTWTRPPQVPSGFRSAVAHVPGVPDVCLIAVGPSGADISYDGGRSWTRLQSDGYHSVSFAGKSTIGYASGYDGRVARLVFR